MSQPFVFRQRASLPRLKAAILESARRITAWVRRQRLLFLAQLAASKPRARRITAWVRRQRLLFLTQLAASKPRRIPLRVILRWVARRWSEEVSSFQARLRTYPQVYRRAAVAALLLIVVTQLVSYELRTSELQARVLSWVASQLNWELSAGPNPDILLPRHGPADVVRGYSELNRFSARLTQQGFRVVEQARLSPSLKAAMRLGITPPYREPMPAGLVMLDRDGKVIYDARRRRPYLERFEDAPPMIVNTLLMMENRQLAGPVPPRANHAVDWGRMARATAFSVGNRLGLPASFQGGSTLAVQIEKTRHSDGGRTQSVVDKLRQVVSASVRLYRDGPDTRQDLQEIVLDYLNTVPLGAAPGHGEVYGLAEGLTTWFALDPARVFAVLAKAHEWGERVNVNEHARALKPVIALLCAVRAPTHLLVDDRLELERRVRFYENRMLEVGLIDPELREALYDEPIRFAPAPSPTPSGLSLEARKASDRVRRELVTMLGLKDFYELDRLDLEVETSLDGGLADSVKRLFDDLTDPEYVAAQGLVAPRLLEEGDPRQVVYSLLLYEAGREGNVELIHADNLDRPFDFNEGARLELGSTAKLRTLVCYMQVVEQVHNELAGRDPSTLEEQLAAARDPITRWVAAQLMAEPGMSLDSLLAHALEREYSASPHEAFMTGGGLHTFGNFDPDDDGRTYTIHEALVRSSNLPFIRLMRDVVRWHEARLPYDAQAVIEQPDHPLRQRMLEAASEEEAKTILRRAWRRWSDTPPQQILEQLVGDPRVTPREWASFAVARNPGAPAESLAAWLMGPAARVDSTLATELAERFATFTILDAAYVLRRHPLELWVAAERSRDPQVTWEEVLARSGPVREEAQRWLLSPRQRHAQNVRLRARIERDAFEVIRESWKRLGFPFDHLVPSLATAIGSSADRPEALASLMGLIVNDGLRRDTQLIRWVRFGAGTPYETTLEAVPVPEERLLSSQVAQTVRRALADVVDRGTARRVRDAFTDEQGEPIVVGGKTGSGDNRYDVFSRGGQVVDSKPTSRTAAFAFYLSDRYYGVITASVMGPASGNYKFTSALPLEVLKRLAPALRRRLG